MKKEKRTLWISLILNLTIVGMELYASGNSFSRNGTGMFRFYTEDSNLLALFACLLLAVFTVRALCGRQKVPQWVMAVKYTAVCCLSLTFLVVVCVLAPMAGGLEGYRVMLLTDSMLFQHLLCPVLALVSFLIFEREPKLSRRHILFALLPTALYALVTILLNLLRLLSGPYPFLMVYAQPVWASILWCIGILGAAGALCALVFRLGTGARRKAAAQN